MVLRILCLLIVQFLQVRLSLELVVAPSEKCPPLRQSLIACQLNRSRLLADNLRRPGTVSTSQWGDHNRLSGWKRHRKWGKWLKSTFSSLEWYINCFVQLLLLLFGCLPSETSDSLLVFALYIGNPQLFNCRPRETMSVTQFNTSCAPGRRK